MAGSRIQGIRASAVACAHQMGDISQGLHASVVAFTYLANDIGQRQAGLDKASTYQPWRMCNG